MKNQTGGVHWLTAVKLGGVLIATCIGSGFATGAEFLQFFNVYGVKGAVGALIVSCTLFILFSVELFDAGQRLPAEKRTSLFTTYFGKVAGTILDWYCALFVGGCYFIMLTGAGATMHEYMGWKPMWGSILMAVLCVSTILLGLRKLTNVIGTLGPILILATIIIGLNALFKMTGSLSTADSLIPEMGFLKAGPNWFISGICYGCACMQILIPVLPSVGATAQNRKTAVMGAVFGCVAYHLALACLIFAIFGNLPLIRGLQVPNIALAGLLGPGVSSAFVIMIMAAIYTSACPMMYSFCAKIFKDECSPRFKIGVCAFTIASLAASYFFTLDVLINFVYSISGYICTAILIGMFVSKYLARRQNQTRS